MIVPAFSQGLYGRLRQLAAADWQRYVAHPFVQQLADGTLAENAFRRYLTQDYLFLIHFARSYALLVSKLRALPEMRAAAASMNAILNELPLHVGYCAQWGISEPEMAAQPEAPETLNYTRYVLDIGHSGDALDLLVALMPCVAATPKSVSACCSIPPPDWTITPTPHGSATMAMKAICRASAPRWRCWKRCGSSAGARRESLS